MRRPFIIATLWVLTGAISHAAELPTYDLPALTVSLPAGEDSM